MTREQAKHKIDLLDFYLQNHTDDYGEESHTAMMMAIKALEQQTCEDAVSREAVLGLFAQNADAVRPYNKTWEEVKALPSVNPQPKTGQWFAWKPDDDVWRTTCSECGEETRTLWNYCPNCGAKMIEPQESEDKCKNCEYYHNPDYTRCHKCKAESEE